MSDIKRGAGRPPGALNTRTQELQRRFVELLDDDAFDGVVLSLIRVAVGGKREADRVNAAKYLLDRLLGKVPDVVNVQSDAQSVNDLLRLMRQDTARHVEGETE